MSTLSAIQLFLKQLEELYHAETQLASSLHSLAEIANHPGLRHMIVKHLGEIDQQKLRMESIFERYGITPGRGRSPEVQTFMEEGKVRVDAAPDAETRDLLLIVECIKIDHYEMGAYEITAAFAEQLGLSSEAELLAECLAERDASAEILRKLRAEILKLAFPTEIPPEPIFKE